MIKIAIWGAGKFGRYIKNQLNKRDDVILSGFIDSNVQAGESVEGIRVLPLSQIKEQQVDLILIAIVECASVFKQLRQENIEKVGIVRKSVYTLKKELSENILEDKNILWLDKEDIYKPFINYLETNIMDSCNLNCRGCSHFSNLFSSDEHIPLDVFCQDLKKIAEHVRINTLYLLGGEPLLNEKLTDYLNFARKILPSGEIEIVTNGLLIPKQTESFFKSCRDNDIIISISSYKPTLMMGDRIIDILEDNEVNYVFRKDVLSFGKILIYREGQSQKNHIKDAEKMNVIFSAMENCINVLLRQWETISLPIMV